MIADLGKKYEEIATKLDAQSGHLEQIRKNTRPPELVPAHRIRQFTVATSGWSQIVAPHGAARIAVVAFVVVANGAVNFTIGEGNSVADAGVFSGNLGSGALPLATNTGFSTAISWPSYLFATGPGLGFFINLDAAVSVSGFATFALLYTKQEAAG